MAKRITTSYTLELDVVAEIQKRSAEQETKASTYVNNLLRILLEMPDSIPTEQKPVEELDQEITTISLKLTELKQQREKEKKKKEQKKLKGVTWQQTGFKNEREMSNALQKAMKYRKG